jgi:hypothetical protein
VLVLVLLLVLDICSPHGRDSEHEDGDEREQSISQQALASPQKFCESRSRVLMAGLI